MDGEGYITITDVRSFSDFTLEEVDPENVEISFLGGSLFRLPSTRFFCSNLLCLPSTGVYKQLLPAFKPDGLSLLHCERNSQLLLRGETWLDRWNGKPRA